jgi:hypothetical protein
MRQLCTGHDIVGEWNLQQSRILAYARQTIREPVIHKALGDVDDFDVGGLLEVLAIDDELVCDEAFLAAVDSAEGAFESLGHVVGVENGDLDVGISPYINVDILRYSRTRINAQNAYQLFEHTPI